MVSKILYIHFLLCAMIDFTICCIVQQVILYTRLYPNVHGGMHTAAAKGPLHMCGSRVRNPRPREVHGGAVHTP